ncbi:cysteine hydrolase family protein [Amycolatopsis thermophila]|uniref:Nicotinamidase-related amidase n=1 Tax=Amycolatopsis thermophila TaxID=206084 RepID=A0ABU0F2A6_9PSEU|nr:isochorismatase family cysteine hydrolase [Amycolatopsis thermophila]MDQ0381707.1 nicotinamidase-related amidase [Amycolatopsis thermophila]
MDEYTRPEFSRSALLTIDLQQDFLDIPGTRAVLPAVRRLTRAFLDAGRPVVHAVRLYRPDGSNAERCRRATIAAGSTMAAPGSAGSQLADGLGGVLDHETLLAGEVQEFRPGEYAMYKPRWSAFFRTPLAEHLAPVTTVVVTGANYPNCPRSTLIEATELDFRTVAVRDAISGWADAADRELAGLGIACLPEAEVLSGLAGVTACRGGTAH